MASGLELEDVDNLFKKDDGVFDAVLDSKTQPQHVETTKKGADNV